MKEIETYHLESGISNKVERRSDLVDGVDAGGNQIHGPHSTVPSSPLSSNPPESSKRSPGRHPPSVGDAEGSWGGGAEKRQQATETGRAVSSRTRAEPAPWILHRSTGPELRCGSSPAASRRLAGCWWLGTDAGDDESRTRTNDGWALSRDGLPRDMRRMG